MHIRDQELLRLEKYANGLGIKVTYKKLKPDSKAHAEWTVDGKEIILYVGPRDAKVTTVLNFLHELGHHMDHVYKNRQRDREIERALGLEANRDPLDSPIDKKLRKLIYDDEVDATKYRVQIAHEIGLKVPEWRIKADIELDCWIYHEYYISGDVPIVTKIREKKRELIKSFRSKK